MIPARYYGSAGILKIRIMETKPHNPDYKLVSVKMQNKDFVLGISNDGQNEGLEVYHYKEGANHFYYSRRYRYIEVPMIYLELYLNLKSQIADVPAGHNRELTVEEYREIAYKRLTKSYAQ